MTEIWLFEKDILVVVAIGFVWFLFIISSIATVVFTWRRILKRHYFVNEDEWGSLLSSIVVACITGFFLLKIHGVTISNWLLSSAGMFGKEIGGYEQRFLESYRLKIQVVTRPSTRKRQDKHFFNYLIFDVVFAECCITHAIRITPDVASGL